MNCKVCGNTSAKNSSISFFRFPKENSKCRDWADRCHLLGLFEKHGTLRFYKSFRICSEHFDPKDVVFDGRKKRLLQSATPRTPATATTQSIQQSVKNFTFQLPQNLCRLCAEANDNLTDIFGWKGELLNLERKLKYFPQEINKNDILPLKICHECESKVNQFYDFIMECTKAETKLRAMLDINHCSTSSQLTKSEAGDKMIDWDSGVKTCLNETPKIHSSLDSMTGFQESMTPNYYDQVLEENFICGDDADYLSRVAEAEFAMSDQIHSHTNFIKEVDFRGTVSFEHEYSDIVSRDEFQSELKIQAPPNQNFTGETQEVSCDVCLESFSNSEALSAHSLAHSMKWDLNGECLTEICDKVFCDSFNLENHSSLEMEENKTCKVCDKRFHKVAFLEEHSLAQEPCDCSKDSRPCQIRRESKAKACFKRFLKCDQTKSSLNQKLKRSHSKLEGRNSRLWERILKKEDPLAQDKVRIESHRCDECGKFFRSKASLRQHKSVHSDKRVHACKECGMSFKRKDTLCNHLRIHTGERPFVCKVCGFAFKQRGDCIKHERNHGRHSEILSEGERLGTENQI